MSFAETPLPLDTRAATTNILETSGWAHSITLQLPQWEVRAPFLVYPTCDGGFLQNEEEGTRVVSGEVGHQRSDEDLHTSHDYTAISFLNYFYYCLSRSLVFALFILFKWI